MTTLLVLAVGGPATWLLVRRQRVRLRTRARHRLEDALKHLFEQEYRGRYATLASLAGALRVSDATVIDIVGRLQKERLLVALGQEFDLTPDGERLALQIIRAHRLLERYFADEARMSSRFRRTRSSCPRS